MRFYTFKFRILTAFALVSSFLLVILGAPRLSMAQDRLAQGDFQALKHAGQASVSEVIDPLTVLLDDGRIIRLAGIDVPNAGGSEFDVLARDILRDLLGGRRVTLHQTRKKDTGRINRMGHHIAHITRSSDEVWAQGVLLSLGLARVKTTKRTPEMAAQMLALEATARAGGVGLWVDQAYMILSADEMGDPAGQFVIAEGQIKSVSLKKNRIYMNFGGNWRSDFTVSIAPEDKRAFSKAQANPMSWGGQNVRVRGILKSINGPYIEIDHPEAIELLENKAALKQNGSALPAGPSSKITPPVSKLRNSGLKSIAKPAPNP